MQETDQPSSRDAVVQDKAAQLQGADLPSAVWPGMTLNWDSPARDIVLHAELPFWLLMPDCELSVTVSGCTLSLSISGQAIEIQHGRAYKESHGNAALIEKVEGKPSDRAAAIISAAKSGFTLRTTRTLISIKTKAIDDALIAIQEPGRRRVDAAMYFHSFVHAHLPFINKAINAYRRVAADPFAIEVTEWDLHVWYLDTQDKFIPISLVPYKAADEFPRVGKLGGDAGPMTVVEAKDVQEALRLPDLPGEIDLFDAWSLYYRGRQSDAIRSIITSIEVLLEAKLREALTNKGLTESELQARLDSSWNNFQARLTEYVHASGRRVPGPYISAIPYINGVRLREELEQARELRHKIVHEGERIAYPFTGRMQRVMETMSWFFNWLAENGLQRKRGLEGNPLTNSMRGRLTLDFTYAPSGVVVRQHDLAGPVVFAEEELRKQLVAAIDKETADIEKFALMALKQVGFEGSHSPAPEPDSSFVFERLILKDGDGFVPLFLHDTYEMVGADVIERIAARLLALKLQGQQFSLALLIVNTQNGLEWQLREIGAAVNESAIKMASQCGIGIVTTVDLLLLIRAAEGGLWSLAEVKQSLVGCGRVGWGPSGYRYAGFVRKFYGRPQVASVVLEDSATLQMGDYIAIRLADRYCGQQIESMQLNRIPVTEAHACTVGIQTTLRRSEVGVGDYVFVRTANSAGEAGSASSG